MERGAHAGAALRVEPVTPGRPILEQSVKNSSLWEGLLLEKFMEDCLPWEGPHARAEECEEEEAAETTCSELTVIPIPRPPALLRGKRQSNLE